MFMKLRSIDISHARQNWSKLHSWPPSFPPLSVDRNTKKMLTQTTQIANCKLWPTSQSTRKTWHPNPHLAPLVGLCSVSAGYLIGGWASSPILIIRRLDLRHKACFFEIPPPKFWQNRNLLAICVFAWAFIKQTKKRLPVRQPHRLLYNDQP